MNINIEEFLNLNEGYLMFSRENCRYCTWTKEYFQEHNIVLNIMSINDYEERLNIYDGLNKYLNRNDIQTLPQIFFNSNHIGGSDNLNKYFTDLEYQKKGIKVYSADEWIYHHTNPFEDPEIMQRVISENTKSTKKIDTITLNESSKLIESDHVNTGCPCCNIS